MRAIHSCVLFIFILAACSGKKRPFADESVMTSERDDGGAAASSPGEPFEPSADGPEGPGDTQGDVGGPDPSAAVLDDGVSPPVSCSGDAGCEPLPSCDDGTDCEAICPGCLIEGECVAVETAHPSNVCLICNPERDSQGWSPNGEASCDDGLFCTVNDACREGACVGEQRVCDDGVACNGVSTCNEAADGCSPDVNQCGANGICDVLSGSCVSTCQGCLINDVCLPAGAEANGNPCLGCDPTRSSSSLTAAVGKACGSGANACSSQSTCDAVGRCQSNHLPANTPCGNPTNNTCNQPDSCDGNGTCLSRLANNGGACEDGQFCTVGDQCQGGQCVATGNLNCGANRSCDESTNACRCDGCSIGNSCFGFGALNPANPCQICDPGRSVSSFSANIGATCGAGPSECSAQDTCNAQGQCSANDRPNGTTCSLAPGATCRDGGCRAPSNLLGPCEVDGDCARGECLSGICALQILSIRVLGTEVPGGASPQNFMDGWFTSNASGRNLVRVSTIPPGVRMYLGLDMTSTLTSPLPPNNFLVLTSVESSDPLTRTFQFNLSDGTAILETVEASSSGSIVLSPGTGDLFRLFEWTGADVNALSKTY